MPLRSFNKKQSEAANSASYTITIPKDDLRMDGYLALLEQLEDHEENLQVHIERTGTGEWRVETREDLLSNDIRAQLDLPVEQQSLDDIEIDAEAD